MAPYILNLSILGLKRAEVTVDKMKKNEVGVACTTYGEEESCIEDFGGVT